MDYNEQNDDGNDCIKQQWFVESYIMTMLDVVFVFKQELFYQSIQGRFVEKYRESLVVFLAALCRWLPL